MPKLRCPCGYTHDLTPLPDDGWHTIRDRDYHALVPSDSEKAIDLWYKIIKQFGSLYECPECGRLMWEKPGVKGFVTYRRDE